MVLQNIKVDATECFQVGQEITIGDHKDHYVVESVNEQDKTISICPLELYKVS